MSKQIRYAGYSILPNGTWKFRTATNVHRIDQLINFGEEVHMIILPTVVASKSEAAKALLAMNYKDKDNAAVDFFVQNAKDENPFKRSARVVKVTVPNRAIAELTGETVKVHRGPFGKVFPEIRMTPKQAEQVRAEWNAKHKNLA